MKDSECLLLNFHNENNSVAVGFRCWLDFPHNDKRLREIIEEKETIVLKWPDCNVEPASKMLKKIETCKWKSCVATILAAGSWVELNEKAKTLINLNVLESTKSSRKLLRHKNHNDDESHYEKENKKKVADGKKDSRKTKRAKFQEIDLNKEEDFLKELQAAQLRQSQDQVQITLILKREVRHGNTIMSDDESSDSSTSPEETNRNRLHSMLKQMKKLENENATLKALLNKSDTGKPSVEIETTVSPSATNQSENSRPEPTNKEVENVPSLYTQDTVLLLDGIADLNGLHKEHENVGDSVSGEILLDGLVPVSHIEPAELKSQQMRVIAHQKSTKQLGKHKEKYIIIGGRECNYSRVMSCNRSSVSKFTMELSVIVFDKEELAECSISGKVSNFHKKNSDIIPKKKLCPIRKKAMEDYVLSIFGHTNDNKILFNNALRKKLNNVFSNSKKNNSA